MNEKTVAELVEGAEAKAIDFTKKDGVQSYLDGRLADSKVWRFDDYICQTSGNVNLCKLNKPVLTFYRSPSGAYLTLEFGITGMLGWYTNSRFVNPAGGIAATPVLYERNGGPLQQFIFEAQDQWCHDEQRQVVVHYNNVDPGLFPLATGATFGVSDKRYWWKCGINP